MCLMSMMWWARIPSHHLACAVDSLSFSSKSHGAWQSVSMLIGNPHRMSVNLSKQNFSAVNSNRNDLYFSLVHDIHFDANPMGCSHVTTFPFGSLVLNHWETDPLNPWPEPSDVTTNDVPSNFGPFKMGSLVSSTLSLRNDLVCLMVQMPANLCKRISHWYAALPMGFGILLFPFKSVSGTAILL